MASYRCTACTAAPQATAGAAAAKQAHIYKHGLQIPKPPSLLPARIDVDDTIADLTLFFRSRSERFLRDLRVLTRWQTQHEYL